MIDPGDVLLGRAELDPDIGIRPLCRAADYAGLADGCPAGKGFRAALKPPKPRKGFPRHGQSRGIATSPRTVELTTEPIRKAVIMQR